MPFLGLFFGVGLGLIAGLTSGIGGFGTLIGAVLGLLCGVVVNMRQTIWEMDEQLKKMDLTIRQLQHQAQQPARLVISQTSSVATPSAPMPPKTAPAVPPQSPAARPDTPIARPVEVLVSRPAATETPVTAPAYTVPKAPETVQPAIQPAVHVDIPVPAPVLKPEEKPAPESKPLAQHGQTSRLDAPVAKPVEKPISRPDEVPVEPALPIAAPLASPVASPVSSPSASEIATEPPVIAPADTAQKLPEPVQAMPQTLPDTPSSVHAEQAALTPPDAPPAKETPAVSTEAAVVEAEAPTIPEPKPIQRPAPIPRAPVEPQEPQGPSFIERGLLAAKEWLFGGNTLVRMGMLLVFLGLAFLLRYASDRIVIPLEVRYLGVACASFVALALGWRLRIKRPAYALLMQGGSVAVMYLTVFAALKLHDQPLIPLQLGLFLLIAVAALSAVLAITQNAMSLAVAGSLGGFAAPVLVSTGGGSHVALFSYFALLNAAILAIAWFKAWRPLNLIGFFGTFSIGLSWGLRSYQAQDYASCQAFLVLFFLMFVGIGLLFARRMLLDEPDAPRGEINMWADWLSRQGERAQRYVDGTILFGTPLVGFGIQHTLVKPFEYGAAFSALALGLFYMLLARLIHANQPIRCRLLTETFLALGVIFATLAIPLGLNAEWTSAAWAVEAAGIYWIGHRQHRPLTRAFALLVQLGAAASYLSHLESGDQTLLHGSVLGAAMLGLSLLCNGFVHTRHIQREQRAEHWDGGMTLVFHTLGLWCLFLIAPLLNQPEGCAVALALGGVVVVSLGLLWRREGWQGNALLALLIAALTTLCTLRLGAETVLSGQPVVVLLIAASLLGSVGVMRWFLRREDYPEEVLSATMPVLSTSGLWFLYLIAPLSFKTEMTAATWAMAGLATAVIGLRLNARAWLGNALLIQVLGAILALYTAGPGEDTVLYGHPFVMLTVAAGFLGTALAIRKLTSVDKILADHPAWLPPALSTAGLWFLYLIAPICLNAEKTVAAWALAGLATAVIGLRMNARAWLGNALLVQVFGAVMAFYTIGLAVDTVLYGNPFVMLLVAVGFLGTAVAIHKSASADKAFIEHLAQITPILSTAGLWFLYLIAPICLNAEKTVGAWALAGLATAVIGLRLNARAWLSNALLVQVIGAVMALCTVGLAIDTVLYGNPIVILLVAVGFLGTAAAIHKLSTDKAFAERLAKLSPILSTAGLWFLYLIAPICLDAEKTAAALALAGLATAFIGLRLQARAWLSNAFLAQLVAGALFLLNMHQGSGDTDSVLAVAGSGWYGLIIASLIGLSSLASIGLALRDARARENNKLVNALAWMMVFGLGFLSLAVLFVLPWQTATAVWAVCGFFLLWATQRLGLRPAFWFAVVLEVVAGLSFALSFGPQLASMQPELAGFAHPGFWTPIIIALSAFALAWRLHAVANRAEQAEKQNIALDYRFLVLPALLWSAVWWVFGWNVELVRLAPTLGEQSIGHRFLAITGAAALVLLAIARRWRWTQLTGLCIALLPLTIVNALSDYQFGIHLFGQWGLAGFGLALAAQFGILHVAGQQLSWPANKRLNIIANWILLLVASLELRHVFLTMGEAGSSWRWLGWVLPLVAWLVWSARRAAPRLWPAEKMPMEYKFSTTLPLVIVLMVWMCMANFGSGGNSAPLPYLPVLNPLDLAMMLILFATWRWLSRVADTEAGILVWQALHAPLRLATLGIAFLTYTCVVLRAVHHYADLPYEWAPMMNSMIVQASLSITWSLCAIGAMILGNRVQRREIWVSGAVLVAIVVAKLFLIELSNRGGLERIISFIGVGVLLLVVGYFAPLPARKEIQS